MIRIRKYTLAEDFIFQIKLNLAMSITRRETEVLNLISHGYSRKQIADKMFLSQHTVNDYMKSLLAKFKANNVAELTRKGFEEGLLRVQNAA